MAPHLCASWSGCMQHDATVPGIVSRAHASTAEVRHLPHTRQSCRVQQQTGCARTPPWPLCPLLELHYCCLVHQLPPGPRTGSGGRTGRMHWPVKARSGQGRPQSCFELECCEATVEDECISTSWTGHVLSLCEGQTNSLGHERTLMQQSSACCDA